MGEISGSMHFAFLLCRSKAIQELERDPEHCYKCVIRGLAEERQYLSEEDYMYDLRVFGRFADDC